MAEQTKADKFQNMFIALAIGLVIPPAIGFGGGFWVTDESADRAAARAVVTTETEVCVGQFTEQPNYQAKLKELKALEYAAQITYVEKGGWSKMPGDQKADEMVTRECNDRLQKL